jgi:hypothetical protein
MQDQSASLELYCNETKRAPASPRSYSESTIDINEVEMEAEQRIKALEEEVRTLKLDIQRTLVEIRDNLPEQSAPATKWEKKAWIMALLNIMLAVVLFSNISFFMSDGAVFGLNATLSAWIRGLWVALAFVWLLLQMYPLALLLGQEDQQWKEVVWRNALVFFRARPGFWVLLTLIVLVVAIVETVVPAAWLIIAIALLVAVASFALRSMLELFQKQGQAH